MELSQKMAMYGNVGTAPTFIKLRIRDAESGGVSTLILENGDFADFIARERRIGQAELAQFYRQDYVDYMLKNADRPLEVDLERFADLLARTRFGSPAAARRYLASRRCANPMSLQDRGVPDRVELLGKYFEFDRRTATGTLRPGFPETDEPCFIALLIELGYVVSKGDIAPLLKIHAPDARAR